MLFIFILILFFLISLYRVKLGLFLLLALIPTYLLKTQIWFIPTTFLELMIYTVFLAWLIRPRRDTKFLSSGLSAIALASAELSSAGAKAEASAKDGCVSTVIKKIRFPLLLLFLALIISVIISPDKLLSLGILKGWFLDPFLLFLVLADTLKKTNKIQIFFALICSGLIISLYGLYDFFITKNLIIPERLDSFFTSPNYVSLYLTPLIILSLGVSIFLIFRLKKETQFTKKNYLYFIFFNFSFLIFSFTLYLTKSFSGWIAFLAGLCFFWLFIPQRKIKIISLLAGLLLLLPILIKEYKDSQFIHYNDFFKITSFESRIDIWKGALGLVSENPILGIGLGNFKNAFPEYAKTHPEQFHRVIDFHNALFAHNLYLTFWLETGLLGLLAFFWLLIIFYKQNFKKYKQGSKEINSQIIIMAAMTSLLVHGLFDTSYFKNDLSILFWIILLYRGR